ncbi:hypothetical protein R1flu_026405 [Riccia fluitans]|uniref:Uncharacterized protein n=1 Tax=Riccia fluitans TaxID=41844 RepID=A0ABD1XFW3_9MARC
MPKARKPTRRAASRHPRNRRRGAGRGQEPPRMRGQPGPPPPTRVEKTLLDQLAKISRPEAMSGTVEEDQAVRDVVKDPALPCIVPGEPSEASMAQFSEQMIPQVPGLTIHAPAVDRIDELQVLCAAVASWAGELKQEVFEDRRTRGELLERANGAQAERDLAERKYELSVSPHPTLAELMDAMDHRVHHVKNDTATAQEARDKAWAEAKRVKEDLQRAVENHQQIMELKGAELRELRREHDLLTTPESPRATDLVQTLVETLRCAQGRVDGLQRQVEEKDKELERLKAELEKTNTDWQQKARDLEAEIYQVRTT